MTHQEFNHFFVRFTKNKKGISYPDVITTTGYELKDFVDFIEKEISENR